MCSENLNYSKNGYTMKRNLFPVRFQLLVYFCCLFSLIACNRATQEFRATERTTITASSSISISPSPIGKASATLSITSTVTKTVKPPVTSTWIPSKTPAPTLSPTLIPRASSYLLRTWTEKDSAKWIDEAGQLPREKIEVYPKAVVAFQSEQLLRFPDSENWRMNAWKAIRTNPMNDHLPGISPGQTAFSWMLENLFNQHEITIEDFLASPDDLPFYIADSLTIENLFGDGQDAVIFNAESFYDIHLCGTFGLHKAGDLYRVETIRNWAICSLPASGVYFTIEALGDTNGNGLPELGMLVQAGYNGIPQSREESLWWYEWDSVTEAFHSQRYQIVSQTCDEFGDGPCHGKHTFQGQSLTISEYWYTQPGCPDLEIQQTYFWNGREYAFARKHIVPAPAEPAQCRLAWADEMIRFYGSGQTNNDSINIVAEMVENWSDVTNLWGPAGKDYFQLRLGIWRDLRGEDDAAVNLLQSLATHPSEPQYNFASQIASIYLENRALQGIFKACLAAENAWNASLHSDFPEIYHLNDLLGKWGFVNRRWTSGMAMDARVESLCTFQDGLAAGVAKLQFLTSSDLQQWLDNAGLQTTAIEAGDFNEDEKNDYLVTVNLPAQGYINQDIWMFVQTSSGTVVSRLESSSFSDTEEIPPISLVWENYRFTDISFPISIVQLDSDLIAFRVDADGLVNILFKASGVKAYAPTGDGFSVVAIDRGHNTQVRSYSWDELTEKFNEQVAGYDFASAERVVEQLLFVHKNYPAVIAKIESFLIEAPSEQNQIVQRSQDAVTYPTDWYHPYLRYLLGIAYEMDGKPELAVETYFLLWQNYPDSIFGQAAMDKLILRQP